MRHAYYLSSDLDEMETVHDELTQSGIEDKHIHVLSDDDSQVEQHHLRSVNSVQKTDLFRCISIGAVLGIALSIGFLAISNVMGLDAAVGNVPFVFGALILLGFCMWEGGLWGIQRENQKYAAVNDDIHHGKHLMIVDYDNEQSLALKKVSERHPNLEPRYL